MSCLALLMQTTPPIRVTYEATRLDELRAMPLVAGMIAMVIISSITLLGPQVQAMFEDLAAAFATIG